MNSKDIAQKRFTYSRWMSPFVCQHWRALHTNPPFKGSTWSHSRASIGTTTDIRVPSVVTGAIAAELHLRESKCNELLRLAGARGLAFGFWLLWPCYGSFGPFGPKVSKRVRSEFPELRGPKRSKTESKTSQN